MSVQDRGGGHVGWIWALASVHIALLAMAPGSALADGCVANSETLGGVINEFMTGGNLPAIAKLVMGMSFIGGIALMWGGMTKLKEAADTGGVQVQYTNGLLRLAAGSFLVALPATVAMSLGTIGYVGDATNLGVMTCGTAEDPGSVGGSASAVKNGLEMASAFAKNAAGPLSALILACSFVIGVVLIASSLFAFAKVGDAQSRETTGQVVGRLVVGTVLVNAGWALDVIGASFGLTNFDVFDGGISKSILGYGAFSELDAISGAKGFVIETASGPVDIGKDVIAGAFMALTPFGLWLFVKGILMVKHAVEQTRQVSMGQGFTHALGGVMLVNGFDVSCIITRTLGNAAPWCGG